MHCIWLQNYNTNSKSHGKLNRTKKRENKSNENNNKNRKNMRSSRNGSKKNHAKMKLYKEFYPLWYIESMPLYTQANTYSPQSSHAHKYKIRVTTNIRFRITFIHTGSNTEVETTEQTAASKRRSAQEALYANKRHQTKYNTRKIIALFCAVWRV